MTTVVTLPKSFTSSGGVNVGTATDPFNVVTQDSITITQVVLNTEGPQGDEGPPGPTGATGADGMDGGVKLTFQQVDAVRVWSIQHTFTTPPSVMILDSTGEQVFGTVSYPSSGTVQVTFTNPMGGTAYLS